jgi:hypothetical protein
MYLLLTHSASQLKLSQNGSEKITDEWAETEEKLDSKTRNSLPQAQIAFQRFMIFFTSDSHS